MARMTKLRDDPTLDELLRDPLTQAVMRADRVDSPKLEAMLRSLAREIGARFDRNAAGHFPPATGGPRGAASCHVAASRIRSQHCGAR
jgi:hypothetical protein